MIFFAGTVAGMLIGAWLYRFFYTFECNKNEVVCNGEEKDREIHKQLERLIAYGNDM